MNFALMFEQQLCINPLRSGYFSEYAGEPNFRKLYEHIKYALMCVFNVDLV